MAEIKLKPCPFCGGEAAFTYSAYEEPAHYSAMCTECKVILKIYATLEDGLHTDAAFDTQEQAAEAWNRRASDG